MEISVFLHRCLLPCKRVTFCFAFPPSLELQELEKKLKSAYVTKERAAQIAEKEAVQREEMVTAFATHPSTRAL